MLLLPVLYQGIQICRLVGIGFERVGIKVAVRTFFDAPRKVHIEPEGAGVRVRFDHALIVCVDIEGFN